MCEVLLLLLLRKLLLLLLWQFLRARTFQYSLGWGEMPLPREEKARVIGLKIYGV